MNLITIMAYQIGHSSSCIGANISVELTAFILKVNCGAAEFFKRYGNIILFFSLLGILVSEMDRTNS